MNSASKQRSPRLRRKGRDTGAYCCVPGCSNTRQKDKSRGVNLSYHRFPLSDPKRTKLWVDRIRRAYWFPKSSDRICSIHFEEGKSDDPQKTGYIPSVFPSRQKVIKRRTTRNSSAPTPTQAKRVCRRIFPDSPVSSSLSTASSDENSSPSITSSDENSSPSTTSSDEISSPSTTSSDEISSPSTTSSDEISSPSTISSDEISSPSTISSDVPDKRQESLTTTPEAIASRKDHDYVYPYIDDSPCNDEMERLKHENILLKQENEHLKKKSLCIDSYKDNDDDFYYMTNLPNYAHFEALAKYLHKQCDGKLNYWRHKESKKPRLSKKKPGRQRSLSFREEMFLVLVRLKRGFDLKYMNLTTGISTSTLSRIFSTWINFLNNELTLLFEMPPINLTAEQTINCMKPFPDMRIMVDCTELFSQRSMDLQARKETFSNYKHHDTVKFLVGMSPHLTVNFVSAAWGGRASDKHITLNSDSLLSNLPPGSSVMADRGFLVTEELRALGVQMIMPHFKGRDRPQFSASEARRSAEISSARIHIERLIRRIKTFQILDRSIRMDQKDLIEQTFKVCAYLVNFQPPIVQQ